MKRPPRICRFSFREGLSKGLRFPPFHSGATTTGPSLHEKCAVLALEDDTKATKKPKVFGLGIILDESLPRGSQWRFFRLVILTAAGLCRIFTGFQTVSSFIRFFYKLHNPVQ
jgi:hypothetical protein